MSSPEVEWVLDQFGDVVDSVANDYSIGNGDPVTLRRVDRDLSVVYDGSSTVDLSTPLSDLTSDLKRGVYVGASFSDRDTEVRGPGYNQNVDAVVGCRIVGMTHRKFGHVDPDGADGIPFEELVRRCRDALWDAASTAADNGSLLGVGSPDGSYYTLDITNEAPVSANWADYFRHDFDLLLVGEKDH